MDSDISWRHRFPRLFASRYVDYADADAIFTTGTVPESLVSRLHLVALTKAGNVVVCESDLGWRFMPGGRREPGESVRDLASRELNEEAGARLLTDPVVFGAFQATSRRDQPYRPHLPHPRAFWAYASARVEVTGRPTSPADGEQIVAVHELAPMEAIAFLRSHDEHEADVLALASAMGVLTSVGGR